VIWACVRNHSNGHPVRRDGEVCKRINVVLHPDLFEKIDLRALQNDWS